MDVADWLQALPTKDGRQFLSDAGGEERESLTSQEFSQKFYESDQGKLILRKLEAEVKGELEEGDDAIVRWMGKKFKNTQLDSLNLVVRRELLLWLRNKSQIKARVAQGKQISRRLTYHVIIH